MRYFIYLQYDGTAYHGWQVQPGAITVQEVIETKLSMLRGVRTPIVGAGRTDTGVHARLMVAHFDALSASGESVAVDAAELARRLNQVLPDDIAVLRIVAVRADAHARFTARSRTYRYYLTTAKSAFGRQYAQRIYWTLDVERMNEAARRMMGYRDFTSFSKLHTDVKTNNCRIDIARWETTADGGLVFTIRADRFLRNMVRAVVGTLMLVGRGRLSVDEFCAIIERRDRCSAGDSAPAKALFLEDVDYPADIFVGQ